MDCLDLRDAQNNKRPSRDTPLACPVMALPSRAVAEENLLQLLTRPGNSLYQGALSLNAGVPGS